MSSRVSLPRSLGASSTLSPSGEGVSIPPQTASQPISPTAARTIVGGREPSKTPSLAPAPLAAQQQSAPITPASQGVMGYIFNPMYIIWIVLIFIIVWLILYSWLPSCIMEKKENGERVLDTSRVILFTVIISVIIVLALWVGMRYRRNGAPAAIATK